MNIPYRRPKMPTYQYKCEACSEVFSRVESILEHGRETPKCSACGSEQVARILVPFYAKTVKKS